MSAPTRVFLACGSCAQERQGEPEPGYFLWSNCWFCLSYQYLSIYRTELMP